MVTSFSIFSKIKTIIITIILILGVIIVRLAYLQVNLTSYFIARSAKNYLRSEHIISHRGNILDRKGKLLATNRPVINLYWQGTGNYFLTEKNRHLLYALETILNTPLNNNNKAHHSIAHAERYYKEKILAQDISIEQLSKIEECFPNHPNLLIKTDFQRLYPYSCCAGHILGYLSSSIDNTPCGKMGLEMVFENSLKGQQGELLTMINAVGRTIAQKEITAARTGKNIQSTLDITLQELCEKVFPPDYTGAMILMDPSDGDILAIVSRPAFDPNLFLSPLSPDQWQTLQEKKSFLNRAFNSLYPPGSLFKLITISAALDQGLITTESTCNCKGAIDFCHRKVRCHNQQGHGLLSISQALAKSCNIICYNIGQKIDIDTLAYYAHLFGLGQKTNMLFPEQSGLVPSRSWKRTTKGEPWWPGETLSVSIGQSFLLVTPIQMAVMISSIFTGNRITPRLLMAEPIQKIPLAVSPEIRHFLQESMKLVVTAGTGKGALIKDYTIYAKTSTAQTSALDKRLLAKQYLEHAWFAAYVQYKQSPPLTLVIVAEHSGSSQIATSIAKDFLLGFKKMIDSSPKNPILAQ